MALDRLGSNILHSLFGRRFGLDHNDFIVGHAGDRIPYENSTAASTLAASGMSILSGSTDVFTLTAPLAAGIEKVIINASSLSTAAMGIVRSTALGACSFLGSTNAGGIASTAPILRVNLVGCGSNVVMRSVSSAVWAPIAYAGNITSSAYTYTISTSS